MRGLGGKAAGKGPTAAGRAEEGEEGEGPVRFLVVRGACVEGVAAAPEEDEEEERDRPGRPGQKGYRRTRSGRRGFRSGEAAAAKDRHAGGEGSLNPEADLHGSPIGGAKD